MTAIANMTSYYAAGRAGQRLSTAECVARLAANGFTHIDMNMCGMADCDGLLTGDDWRGEAEAAREAAEKAGAVFVQSHTPFYRGRVEDASKPEYNAFFQQMMLRSAEINHMLGVPVTVLHPMHAPGRDREDTEAHIAENLRFYGPVAEKLSRYGVCPAFENMISPNLFGAAVSDQLAVIDAFAGYGAAACWDFGHGNLRHVDQCWNIAQLSGLIRAVHIHDNFGKVDDHLLPFLGTVQWERVMPALRKAGYEGDLVLEVSHGRMDDTLRDDSTQWSAKVCSRLLTLFHGE